VLASDDDNAAPEKVPLDDGGMYAIAVVAHAAGSPGGRA
jgi:hypothetical protein